MSNEITEGAAQENSVRTPARRRTGRRVVRESGAAGARKELIVQDHSHSTDLVPKSASQSNAAPVVVPEVSEKAQESNETVAENQRAESARKTVRRRRVSQDAASVQFSAAQSTSEPEEPAQSMPVAARPIRPIASLLFQEPVLPVRTRRAENEEDAYQERESELTSRRRNRTRRGAASMEESVSNVEDAQKNRNTGSNKANNANDTDENEEQLGQLRTARNERNRGRGRGSAARNERRAEERDENRSENRNETRGELAETSSKKHVRRSNHNGVEREYSGVTDDFTRERSSRRSRRLNAQERRAAAEVEQIEEDLELDIIEYLPIALQETLDELDNNSNARNGSHDEDGERGESFDADDNQDNDDEIRTTRRRRRRSRDENRSEENERGRDERGAEDEDDDTQEIRSRRRRRVTSEEDDEPTSVRTRRRRRARMDDSATDEAENSENSSSFDDDDDDDLTLTRRRRRRRSKASDETSSAAELTPRRSRKQQYIDEITDIEGSTRLEAKKQRRRDNRRERSRQSQIMEQDFLARRENVERLMVVRERGHHTQISVIEDNILVEHYVSDIQEVATVGNIYLGRVQNVLPSMEAAFVDIGQARNGVLYAGEVNWDTTRLEGQPRRIELAFKTGDPVLVQVTKDPIGHKGARLTSQVTLAGRFLVLVPSGGMTGVSRKLSDRERSRLKSIVSKIAPKDMGVIIRTAAEGASEEAITKDLESLLRQWHRIEEQRELYLHGKRPKLLQGEPDVAIRVVRDIFNDDFKMLMVEGTQVYSRIEEYLEQMAPDLKSKLERWDPAEHGGKDVFDHWQIDSQLRKGMERQVYLPSGGSIVIDRTEAMTTIDVNTGRFIGKGKSLEETVTRCNLEASEEIARQLRLRDIGGMVMIDYVDMVMPANRDLVLRRLVECLARDRTKHQVAEVTSLGLVQMTRKRIGQGLVEAFSEECPTCKGRGFILHDEPTVSAEFDDPYALKGGDPFVKTNKHGQGTQVQAPQGSSADVRAKLAQIAAAAVAANNEELESESAAGSEEVSSSSTASAGTASAGTADSVNKSAGTESASSADETGETGRAADAEQEAPVQHRRRSRRVVRPAQSVETAQSAETAQSGEATQSATDTENSQGEAPSEQQTQETQQAQSTQQEQSAQSAEQQSDEKQENASAHEKTQNTDASQSQSAQSESAAEDERDQQAAHAVDELPMPKITDEYESEEDDDYGSDSGASHLYASSGVEQSAHLNISSDTARVLSEIVGNAVVDNAQETTRKPVQKVKKVQKRKK